MPKSDTDSPPELFGDKDLAYEIPTANLHYYVQGSESTWLPISSMPVELRAGGWVYLKSGERLVAKAKVKAIGFRKQRWTHESADTATDIGPGATLELDGDDWQLIKIELGPDGDAEVPTYRYLVTNPDGTVTPA